MVNKITCFFLAFLMHTSCVSHGTHSDREVVITFVKVESVKMVLLHTFPVSIQIIVHGQKGKDVDVDVKQERKDREVTVTMTQTHSQRIQPRMVPFKERVFLAGGFTPGTYLLRVNNYSVTFEVM